MSKREGSFVLSFRLTGARRFKENYYTVKSARHAAKTRCNNQNVEEIVLTGPGISTTVLFKTGE